MTLISMMYELPVILTAIAMPCLSHAKFTDRSLRGSDDYYTTALRDALSTNSGLSGTLEAYSELCGKPNIDEALRLADVYRQTGDQVIERYGVQCHISLEGELNTNDYSEFKHFSEKLPVKITLQGMEQKVEQGFRDFIDAIGDPYFIARGSDYLLADRVLGTYGLKTKRKVGGCLAGKHIVPAII